MSKPDEIPLSSLAILPEMQVRTKADSATVKRYAQAMATGAKFPPVLVADINGALVLLDGFHRFGATQALGLGHILADIVPMETMEEARWRAAQANLTHGRPLRASERRGVFAAYVKASQHRHQGRKRGPTKSYREMARELGIPHTTLRNWTRKDFPRLYRALSDGGEGNVGHGGLPEADPLSSKFEREARRALDVAAGAISGVSDPRGRRSLLDRLDALRAALMAAGVDEGEQDF